MKKNARLEKIFGKEEGSADGWLEDAEVHFNIVGIGTFLTGIEQPRKKKGTKLSPAKPLIFFGDFKFVLNKKWV